MLKDWKEISEVEPGYNFEYLATMINPKTHRLFDIAALRGTQDVYITLPSEAYGEKDQEIYILGNGQFDKYDSADVEDEAGSYFRSHTPSGVAERNQGYGFLLYSGIALAALSEGGEGIYSVPNDRLDAAEAFWRSQTKKGYARESCGKSSTDSIEVSYPLEYSVLEELVESENNMSSDECRASMNDYPEDVEVQVEVNRSINLNVLPGHSVFASGMVITWEETDRALDDAAEMAWKKAPVEILYEIKLDSCYDSKLILLLLEHIRDEAGADLDPKRLLYLLETAPPEIIESPSDALFQEFKKSERLRHIYLELAGQQKFNFNAAKKRHKELTANPPKHSKAWRDHFGSFVDESF